MKKQDNHKGIFVIYITFINEKCKLNSIIRMYEGEMKESK